MLAFLDALRRNILQKCTMFSNWVESAVLEQPSSSSSSSVHPCSTLYAEVEQLTVKVLLGVQQVMGRHQEQLKEYAYEKEEEEEEGEGEEAEEEKIRNDDTPLCKILHETLLQNIQDMSVQEVCAHTRMR